MCDHDDQEIRNEIAAQRQHENRCTLCDGRGIINIKVPMPFSNGELFETYECPSCHGTGRVY